MRKLTLSIGLIAGILSAKAQDTTCTLFKGKRVIEFNYQTSKAIWENVHGSEYYDIEIKYGDVLCLDLYDGHRGVRTVITTFFDGTTRTDVLNSEDNFYFSPKGAIRVSVGKSRFRLWVN